MRYWWQALSSAVKAGSEDAKRYFEQPRSAMDDDEFVLWAYVQLMFLRDGRAANKLKAWAKQVLEDLASGRHARETAEEEIARLELREADQTAGLTAARQGMEAWEASWAAAATDLQLPKGATVSQGMATLDAIDTAFERITVANGTRRRIDGIERDAGIARNGANALRRGWPGQV